MKSYDVIVQVTAAFSTRLRIKANSEDEARDSAMGFVLEDEGFGGQDAIDWQKDGPMEGDPQIEVAPTKRERKRISDG